MLFLRQDVVSEAEAREVGLFDIGFFGQADLDDRSRHSVALSRAAVRRFCNVRYDADKFSLVVDGSAIRLDGLEDLIRNFRARSILLDATTLDFPEILYILTAYRMQRPRPRCGFFYVEPVGYRQRNSPSCIVPGNAFDLSAGFRERQNLPLYRRMFRSESRTHLIAFLGFEGDRLRRVIDDDDGHFYQRVSVVFGIPPFQPSWDLHALMANSGLLELPNVTALYCGANNPRGAYKILEEAHAEIPASKTDRLVVAPFGTTPMALGVALYCLESHDVYSPIYDHPVKKANRSFGVHRRHWYEVDLSG